MLNIASFFDKFLNLDKNNNTRLFFIIEVIEESTGIKLNKENIKISGDYINIKCNPVFKNEIFFNKDKIETILKNKKIFLNLR